MAAAREVRLSSSSGEEEEEEALERFRESVAHWLEPSGGDSKKKLPSSTEPSLRTKPNHHEQDGNELQTTAEFRAHVAKKLGAILDRFITPCDPPLGPTQNNTEVSETEDCGFRLFSSSVPGDAGEPESSSSERRRRKRRERSPPSSSSETDQEWQRCQEAAVTAEDILKQSALPGALLDSTQGDPCQNPEPRRKKKRKKKEAEENSLEQGVPETAHANLAKACRREEDVPAEKKVRRRKKKRVGENGLEMARNNSNRREENIAVEDMLQRKKKNLKRKKRGLGLPANAPKGNTTC